MREDRVRAGTFINAEIRVWQPGLPRKSLLRSPSQVRSKRITRDFRRRPLTEVIVQLVRPAVNAGARTPRVRTFPATGRGKVRS